MDKTSLPGFYLRVQPVRSHLRVLSPGSCLRVLCPTFPVCRQWAWVPGPTLTFYLPTGLISPTECFVYIFLSGVYIIESYIAVTTKMKRTIGHHSKPHTFIWNMATKVCRYVMFFSWKFIDALALGEFYYVFFNLINNLFFFFY